jgi:putative Mg2+ transporter-C (MgtC) family protein
MILDDYRSPVEHFDTQLHDWIDSAGWPLAALVRLALAALCGALVGLEREVRGRQAGFRTNLLVCLGCAIVMVVSLQVGYLEWDQRPGRAIQIDPARIAYGVMAGIGFLGAGAIIKQGSDVRGLTTAAAIWCVAAIGLGAGLGLYLFSLLATALVLAALWLLSVVERLLPRVHFRAVTLRGPWKENCVSEAVRAARQAGYQVDDWDFERSSDLRAVDITLLVGFRKKQDFDDIGQQLTLDGHFELVAVKQQ